MLGHIGELEKSGLNEVCVESFANHLLAPQFVEWDNCVLLVQDCDMSLPERFIPNHFCPDRTGYEAGFNHVHLNDYIDEHDPLLVLKFGLEIIRVWRSSLKKQFPEKEFVLVLSFDGEECVLRFYMKRHDSIPWIDIHSLEEYQEGIMVVNI